MDARRKYQLRHMKDGLCPQCASPASPYSYFCEGCYDKQVKRMRDRYRLKNGIPLDRPVIRRKPSNRDRYEEAYGIRKLDEKEG